MLLSSKADLPGKSLTKYAPARKNVGTWEASSSSCSSSLALLNSLSKREHWNSGLSPTDLIFPQYDIQNKKKNKPKIESCFPNAFDKTK